MADLTEFLLARIAEDEAATNTASTPFYRQMFNGWHHGEVGGAFIGFTDRFTPDRVLAECEAKRMMLELHGPHGDDDAKLPCRELAVLALPYADHPDYDESWRP